MAISAEFASLKIGYRSMYCHLRGRCMRDCILTPVIAQWSNACVAVRASAMVSACDAGSRNKSGCVSGVIGLYEPRFFLSAFMNEDIFALYV